MIKGAYGQRESCGLIARLKYRHCSEATLKIYKIEMMFD